MPHSGVSNIETPYSDASNLILPDGDASDVTDNDLPTVGVTAVDYDNFALRQPYDRIIRCLGFKFNESLFNQ